MPASAGDGQPSAISTLDAIIAFLFHLTVFAFYLYFLLDTERVLATMKERGVILPESDKYGGHWKFMARLNFVSSSSLIPYLV